MKSIYIDFFQNIQEIGAGSFGKVYRTKWRNSDQYLALKSFFNLDNITIKELIHELELQREVAFHDNIINFYGITTSNQEFSHNIMTKNYLLVMEYANGGSLRNYLKHNFKYLSWKDKYKLAYQLACAVSCLHSEGIVHRDLHSECWDGEPDNRPSMVEVVKKLEPFIPKKVGNLKIIEANDDIENPSSCIKSSQFIKSIQVSEYTKEGTSNKINEDNEIKKALANKIK
ncbi:unnamed protein product [Rhizophagus irregularis]|uniref:Protein kinase domain-containing protein n=1 Tax=Rhizophagus irregularis TaxID=588596 RepID=A0A915YVY5_9GLOM|nr:unnamed protein product [Rhizophagus irregularis]